MKASAQLSIALTTRNRPPRPTQFFAIAAGSHSEACDYCGKAIYFAPHPSTGKPHPVDVMIHPATYAPTSTTWGQGITHFADKNCPRSSKPRLRYTR